MLSQVFAFLRRLRPVEVPPRVSSEPGAEPDMTGGGMAAAVRHWRARKIPLRTPLPAEQLMELLAPWPADMRRDLARLYALCDGMPDDDSDGHTFCLWSLERALAWRDSKPGEFAFADFLIDSHIYVLQPVEPDGYRVVVSHGVGEPEPVAASLDDMFELLLRDARKLLLTI